MDTPIEKDQLNELLKDKPESLKNFITDLWSKTGSINPETLIAMDQGITSKGQLHELLIKSGLKFGSYEYNKLYDGYTEKHILKY